MMTCGPMYSLSYTSNDFISKLSPVLKIQISNYVNSIVEKRVKEEVAREMKKYKEEIRKELIANKKEDRIIL